MKSSKPKVSYVGVIKELKDENGKLFPTPSTDSWQEEDDSITISEVLIDSMGTMDEFIRQRIRSCY